MDTKLTLKLNKDAIKEAKSFARRNHLSLSKMVEQFFNMLSEEPDGNEKQYTPLVRELSGIIKMSKDFDYKREYQEYIEEKYN